MVKRKLCGQFRSEDQPPVRVYACSDGVSAWVEVRQGDVCREYAPNRARQVAVAVNEAADQAEFMGAAIK